MKDSWTAQYNMVKSSRAVLLDYCNTILPAHFIEGQTGFGRGGSIRNLLVHNGHIYQYWMGEQAMGLNMQYPEYTDISTVEDCRTFYTAVNNLVEEFIQRFADMPFEALTIDRKNREAATALEIFTHVVTHEFHHKGQVLSISRQLGYIPVDTDVIR